MTLIVVLEDDPRRVRAMGQAVDCMNQCEMIVFATAPAMILWLASNPGGAQLLSLDIELDASALEREDCGSGEDVAAVLMQRPPGCPIVVHSSNALRAPAMHMDLTLAGCEHVFLAPFRDAETSSSDVCRALEAARGALKPGTP
jgi:hypothetical protein